MPTYAYRCLTCEHAFDAQQSITEPSLSACPSCGGALRKLYAPVGITFNGSGFYRTDSRAGGTNGSSSAPATSGSSSSGSSGSSGSSSGSSGSSSSSSS